MDIIHARLKVAETLAKGFEMAKRTIDGIDVERSSANVFADLGLAEVKQLKIKSGWSSR